MTEKKDKKQKKSPLSWMTEAFNLVGEIIDLVKTESEERLEKIKQKVKYYMIVYGLLLVAMFFILVGFVKELPKWYPQFSEGTSFILVGAVMIVILALYSLVKKA